jgi:hypothetical protein
MDVLEPPSRRYRRWKCVWGPAPRSPSVAVPARLRNREVAVYKPYPMPLGWKIRRFFNVSSISLTVVSAVATKSKNKM